MKIKYERIVNINKNEQKKYCIEIELDIDKNALDEFTLMKTCID